MGDKLEKLITSGLLENAMKLRTHLGLASDHLTVRVSNDVSVVQAERHKAFPEDSQEGDACWLIMMQQENSADSRDAILPCLVIMGQIAASPSTGLGRTRGSDGME